MTDSLTSDDFDDTVETTARNDLDLAGFDPNVLRHPVVARAAVGVVVAMAIVVWPDRTDQVLARLVGLGLLGFGVITIWSSTRGRPGGRIDLLIGFGAVIVGGLLISVPPDRSATMLGRGLGALAVASAVQAVIAVARRQDETPAWSLSKAAVLAGLGGLLVAFPTTMLTTVVAVFGIGWAVLGVIVIAMSMSPTSDGVASYHDAGQLIVAWLTDRPKSADDRQALYAKILYDGPNASRRMVRFFTLMTFASVIASTGVIGDSTAVVIGAMLIAPLMTPLMGMAISLVMGWPNRLARSTVIAVAGIALAITIGVLLGFFSPVAIDTTTNSQILARTSPTTLDLIIAIAAGAAGAYGLSRPDVSDSLPGVAIAISLVPPLTVVGISYSQGDWSAGTGALLLFMTNMLAILLVGGLTFVVTGVTPLHRLTENQHRTRTALAGVAALATVVLAALLLNGAQIARDIANQGDADDAVAAWLEPYPDHDAVQVIVDGDVVTAVVIGPSDGAPPASELADELVTRLGRSATANVRLVVENRDTATASP